MIGEESGMADLRASWLMPAYAFHEGMGHLFVADAFQQGGRCGQVGEEGVVAVLVQHPVAVK